MSIDYGCGILNRDSETGVRYGLIALASLESDIWSDIETLDNPIDREALATYCRERLRETDLEPDDFPPRIADEIDTGDDDWQQYAIDNLNDDEAIDLLGTVDTWAIQEFYDTSDGMDCVGAEGTIDGVQVCVTELGGAYHLWILHSPHVGNYAECSPCAPGAGDLDSPDPNGPLTYDVPPDWRYNPDED